MNLALKWKCSNQIVSEHFHWSSTLQEREMLEFLVRKSWLWIELAHFRKKRKNTKIRATEKGRQQLQHPAQRSKMGRKTRTNNKKSKMRKRKNTRKKKNTRKIWWRGWVLGWTWRKSNRRWPTKEEEALFVSTSTSRSNFKDKDEEEYEDMRKNKRKNFFEV